MPVLSAQFVRVSAYIRGVLRTTRPISFGSGYADLGTDAPYLEVHGEGESRPRVRKSCAQLLKVLQEEALHHLRFCRRHGLDLPSGIGLGSGGA